MNRGYLLERGLAVLEARLKDPVATGPGHYAPEVRPFITLSRETGAGATTVGTLLVPLLDRALGEKSQGWVLLDKNLINHALAQRNLPERLAEHLPEDKISEIDAIIGELVGLHPPLWELEQQVVEAILQLAQVGRVILVGRASCLVTRSLPGGLHVRLVAPPDVRARRMTVLLNCDEATAREHIRRTDRARQRFLRTHYEREINDPHLYDLVANTDQIAPDILAHLIVQALCERIDRLRPVQSEADSRPLMAHGVPT